MPINCVVGGCTRNQYNSQESSFYTFPNDESCQGLWTDFVNNTRSDFVWTRYSRVCNAHFVHDDFQPSSFLKRKFGFENARLLLKPGSVPSLKRPSEPKKKPKAALENDPKQETMPETTQGNVKQERLPVAESHGSKPESKPVHVNNAHLVEKETKAHARDQSQKIQQDVVKEPCSPPSSRKTFYPSKRKQTKPVRYVDHL